MITDEEDLFDEEDFFDEKITAAAADRLFENYQKYGKQAIETIRKENPEMFLRIIAWICFGEPHNE